jgi:SynChlorMet cassette protein ScmD
LLKSWLRKEPYSPQSCGEDLSVDEEGNPVEPHDKPIANPLVVLREEFDDWAILFDPDTGNAFGLNPTGVYLWKLLDGKHSIDEMLHSLRQEAEEVPAEAGDHLREFIADLTKRGLAGHELETSV